MIAVGVDWVGGPSRVILCSRCFLTAATPKEGPPSWRGARHHIAKEPRYVRVHVRARSGEDWRFDEIDSVKITVVAISGQAERIIGAVKEFRIEHSGQTVLFTASRVLTQQLRPLQTREEFDSILSERRFQ